MDITYAKVNYMIAFLPYVQALIAHCNAGHALMPMKSVPISKNVCEVHVDAIGVRYNVLNGYPCVDYATVAKLIPMKFADIPRHLPKPIRVAMNRPFPCQKDYTAFMWLIGNCMMLDPSVGQRFVVLYGKGSNGKSTLIKMVSTCLGTFATCALSD